MGLLALGTPLSWAEAKQHADHVRKHGIIQFLNSWEFSKEKQDYPLLWGDEIEYIVVSYDEVEKRARLSLRQWEILDALDLDRRQRLALNPGKEACIPVFHPEYGRYMLESTPGAPYSSDFPALLHVEGNMRNRRIIAKRQLRSNETPLTLTSFPLLGAPGVFTEPFYEAGGPAARSLFLPDEVANPHVRFPTLTANIRSRRGAKVAINLPIYVDTHTPRPFVDPSIPERSQWPEDAEAAAGAAKPDHIYMDAMGFGMGCCCLQVTFQACCVREARRLYDAFVPLAPLFLALSAAAPIFRGYLADVDSRWNVIAGSVDDRTREEEGRPALQGEKPAEACGKKWINVGGTVSSASATAGTIPKSRYDSTDLYISEDAAANRPEYNDIVVPADADILQTLTSSGIDLPLARHLAHLFIRDPIVIFEETLDQDDKVDSDHFENIQSTNWQTVRFKPPAPGSDMGWRVEFRSMEVQLTDFENAAFSVFLVLLTRIILEKGLNFYVPMSAVETNMQRAQQRDALNRDKFFFRDDISHPRIAKTHVSGAVGAVGGAVNGTNGHTNGHAAAPSISSEFSEYTLQEIFTGAPRLSLPGGLVGLVEDFIAESDDAPEVKARLNKYVQFVRGRADGTYQTAASYIRRYVDQHPQYKHDSVVTSEINYDLVHHLDDIERGRIPPPSTLLPADYTGSDVEIPEDDHFKTECGNVGQ